jgi:hypothetical protein
MRSLREILNEGNPNKVADALRLLLMGNAIALGARFVRDTVTAHVLTLPEQGRSVNLAGDVYATQGGSTGLKAPVPGVPAAGQYSVTPEGNILFAVADAVTEAEITYFAREGSVFEDLVDVTANVATLLGGRGAQIILAVESLAGGATGVFGVAARGSTPGAGNAAIQDVSTGVEFAAADAVTRARVRYIATPGLGDAGGPVATELDVVDKGF